ncbi:inorganic phosphate transporter [Mesobacillus harenae]|uniref:inorganic phosphate transporter n=1 Tax=Mesobacillus harenae TaxID=2213203 RepID=UPI0015806FE6|nr:inorganic phosphate transporter [Mesobacillus harenae]
MTVIVLVFIAAFFFAINIGASGAAATMGIAYGSGAVKNRRLALLICAAGIFLGAALGGGEVAKTLGSGLIPQNVININISLIILSAATLSLFIANIAGIPLSTSEVTVGAIVGVGIAYKTLYVGTLLTIVVLWLVIPLIAFLLAVIIAKFIKLTEDRLQFLNQKKWMRFMGILVVCTGFLEAFSAGMNNVANAVGPLIAAGLISMDSGIAAGGLFVAAGALFLGGRVVETNGKKITQLSLLQGSAVSGLGAALVIGASLFGMPVPQTQITTCSILGVGFADKGWKIWEKDIIGKLLKVWIVSPLFSLVISYNLVKIFLDFDIYSVVIVIAVFVATIGSISLLKSSDYKKTVFYKENARVKKAGGR